MSDSQERVLLRILILLCALGIILVATGRWVDFDHTTLPVPTKSGYVTAGRLYFVGFVSVCFGIVGIWALYGRRSDKDTK